MRAVTGLWLSTLAVAAPIAVVQAQEPTDAEALAAALRAPITATFAGTRLALVVDEVAKRANLNVVLRGANGDAPVTFEARALTADAVLKQLEQQQRLRRSSWCGALVLHPADKALPPEPAVVANAALDARTTQAFEQMPFLLVVERLRTRGLTIDLTPRARARVSSAVGSVTLRVFRMPLRHVLTHLGAAAGLTWSVGQDGKSVTFDTAAAREVDAGTLEVTRDALGEGPQVDVPRAIAELKQPGTRESARRQLVTAGKRAGAPLAALLREADASLVAVALKVLGQVEATDQADAVLALLRDQARPTELRAEAGATLGALKATATVPALLDALDDGSFRVAAAARNALVAIGEPSVAPLLARWKSASATPQGRDGLVYGGLLVLGSLGDPRGKEALLGALKTQQGPRAVPLRHHAAIGLGFTGDAKVVEALIDALDAERDFLVASYIARSLSWITKETSLPPQGARWRAWWQNNKGKFDETKRGPDLYDPLPDLPKGPDGLPLLGGEKPREGGTTPPR